MSIAFILIPVAILLVVIFLFVIDSPTNPEKVISDVLDSLPEGSRIIQNLGKE